MFQKGLTGKGANSADAIDATYADRLPLGRVLTGRMLKNALAQGRSGVVPRKPGPKSAIPTEFVEAISTYAQLRQVAGDEQTPRMLACVARAAAVNTPYEQALSTDSGKMQFLKR